ncbi:MAG: pyridoxal phosphate-dependent aminotransferase [Candidatus Bathyarchaeia archaeon]
MASKRATSIPRSPFYKVTEWMQEHRDEVLDKYDRYIVLRLGDPDFDTPVYVKDALIEAVMEVGTYTHYTGSEAGLSELLDVLVMKLMNDNNIEAKRSNLVVTCGGQAGIYASLMALLNPGDEVLVPCPIYPPYMTDTVLAGGKPVYIPLREENDFSLLPDDVSEALSPRTKALMLCTPNNPTGGVFKKRDLEGIAELAQDHDFIVIADEAYEKIIYDGHKHHSVASFPNMLDHSLTVFSFSKTYAMTGWRVGYVVGNEDLIKVVRKIHHSMNINVTTFVQKAVVKALTGPQGHLKEWLKEYDRRRREIIRALNKVDGIVCPAPKGAYYAFPNVKEYAERVEGTEESPSLRVVKYLIREAGVVTVPGGGFGPYGEGYIRIAFCHPFEHIKEAMRRIQELD